MSPFLQALHEYLLRPRICSNDRHFRNLRDCFQPEHHSGWLMLLLNTPQVNRGKFDTRVGLSRSRIVLNTPATDSVPQIQCAEDVHFRNIQECSEPEHHSGWHMQLLNTPHVKHVAFDARVGLSRSRMVLYTPRLFRAH